MDKMDSQNDASINMLDLRGFDVPTDIVFIVEGHKLYLNKGILASASPVFKKMFHADFKDNIPIEISGKKCTDFVAFLSCIYPSMMDTLNEENIERILPLADEYEVKDLLKECDDVCVEQLKTSKSLNGFQSMFLIPYETYRPKLSDVVHMLVLSEKYNLKRTWHTAFDMATKMCFSNLRNEDEFKKVSSQTITLLMASRIEALETAGKAFLDSSPRAKGAYDFRKVLGTTR